ncbi:MAG: bifunctional 5,10-methylenetetrahydrofolate dehydrogenase/5,10-methenyltetrahydrofolate cyclohydrolase [Elusimicrobiaceae bacterium]|jgi:methylenetetrahydrofolate dehydrogenase (NADP+) / methenyltetrahydrofolate cyclohydrolase|nr:bifunctional 5,10-methylenetetrahydrofolate dehydrogenase/5,10-methenyltetrahydrofolate cyclohydrolase [Elusimicrobiaceae bacterium]MBT3955590.1 bifunctional 5,10-methylenetetrahydrofolate dehydrogenase/5,10-methenyltetrahydrofolate cyclohydrolase [Elusimicrobiaceae bacterium]MBT4008647.1 bifunctional 5,10-methylenetetrahydrofolate dehydrogenase/5,10-methenyltetrahydrofolate cyclohydrolase [Elusimicrobiaceae bacterium]MBT4402745.1 bifunctional 5,10-methylenetetrahydrofolate dehydrogenase/5,10
MEQILEGKTLAKKIREPLAEKVKTISAKLGRDINLLGICNKKDYASSIYMQKEVKAAEKLGIKGKIIEIDDNTSVEEFIEIIKTASADKNLDALLIARPLPEKLENSNYTKHINSLIDIDGISIDNMGKLYICKTFDDVKNINGFVPCTALAVVKLLEYHNIDVNGKEIVVLGRSITVGKPLAHMLLAKNASVKICHSRTKDITKSLSTADIVISAIGRAKFLKKEMLKPNTIVIDVGTNEDEKGNFCGDVDFENIKNFASAISPVPGGVGPVTLACLLENIVISAGRNI